MSHNTIFMSEQENAESANPQLQSGKLLILIRHAKSSWADSSLDDFDRPLNPRGLRDAPEMGKRLASKYAPPNHFASSSATRALATAGIIAENWGFPPEQLHLLPPAYEAVPSTLLDLVTEFPPDARSAALTAHNPSTTILINFLAGTKIPNVPTCGIAVIKFAVDAWKDLTEGAGKLLEYDFPKNLLGYEN